MAKWTLCRQTFGSETYTFSEGDEVSLGRGLNNTITLSSLVISRSHCVMNFQRNQILITDLNVSSDFNTHSTCFHIYNVLLSTTQPGELLTTFPYKTTDFDLETAGSFCFGFFFIFFLPPTMF